MKRVIEIQGRDSKSVQHVVMQGSELRIGRAYDNDIILNDVFVCPHHARLHTDDQGRLFFTDLDSVNGSQDKRHRRLRGDIAVNSGDEFLIGQTHIRIFQPEHPVAASIPRHAVDTLLRRASHPAAIALLLLALVASFVGEEYLLNSEEAQLSGWIQASMLIVLVMLLWTLLWLTISRLSKHEGRFSQQLAITLAFGTLFIVTDGLTEFLRYNLHSTLADQVSEWVIGIGLLWWLLWFNLYTGLAQPPKRRILTASLIAFGLLAVSLLFELEEDDFSRIPDYGSSLMPPALQWTGTVDDQTFLQEASQVFAGPAEHRAD